MDISTCSATANSSITSGPPTQPCSSTHRESQQNRRQNRRHSLSKHQATRRPNKRLPRPTSESPKGAATSAGHSLANELLQCLRALARPALKKFWRQLALGEQQAAVRNPGGCLPVVSPQRFQRRPLALKVQRAQKH
ncbi:Hypothetical predicted protein [Pelobates cultripes]|uniref:Uncharacterized protein n=1 Tax=Pelobates cultripes TaxID=61616 RepID=A0AAD1RDD4_PELCU|nr:Hypothetical predicted protein [Pelobates cultripes]